MGMLGTSHGDGGDLGGGGDVRGDTGGAGEDAVAGVTGLSPQMASRHVALLAVLKLVPRWVAALLVRTGLIYRISPVFRVAATSHSDAVARLTADPDLRALLSYLFYGQGCHDSKGAVPIGRAVMVMEETCVPIGEVASR